MPLTIRGSKDQSLETVKAIFANYLVSHPHAEIEIYRQNSVSIRIRIIDSAFAGVSYTERHNQVWKLLDELPEDVQSQLTTLLLLTPDERGSSFANLEFDEPIPSQL